MKQLSLVIITLLLLLAGCLSTPCDRNSSTTFIGVWKGHQYPAIPVTIEFKSDGIYSVETFNYVIEGTWTLSNKTLLLNESASYSSHNVYEFFFFNNCNSLNLENINFKEKYKLTRS
jgi:hypothetical protein